MQIEDSSVGEGIKFKHIDLGTPFEHEGRIYIKIRKVNNVNAVSLHRGETFHFNSTEFVWLIKAKVVVE